MKKIATLEVYLDPKSEGPGPDSTQLHRTGVDSWEILLKPNGSLQAQLGGGIEQKYPIDSLAHELGHFVGQLFQLPVTTATMLGHFMGIDVPLAPEEIQAWGIAALINPNMEKSPVKELALKGYKEQDEKLGFALEGD